MNKQQAIAIAANWWADTLRNPPDFDSGDGAENAVLDWAKGEVPRPTEDQLLVFQVALEMELVKMLEGCVWNEDNPHRASYFRTVGTDWGPDGCLHAAAQQAGISTLWFPPKTTMWINPDGVRVGHGGEVRQVD